MKGEEKVRENSSRLVYFEDWMDTNAAHKVLEKVDDIQVERLRYNNDKAYNDAAMARAHGYQVQSRTELIEPWFPDSELLLRAPNLVAVSAPGISERRISLTARVLNSAHTKHLVFFGVEKKRVFDEALSLDPLSAPVLGVLDGTLVHWAE